MLYEIECSCLSLIFKKIENRYGNPHYYHEEKYRLDFLFTYDIDSFWWLFIYLFLPVLILHKAYK